MERESHSPENASLLFATTHGWVRYCTCRDVLVLQYRGYWLALPPPRYREFHARLVETVTCPLGRKRLREGGRFAFRTEEGAIAFLLGEPEVGELLWLLDSAHFMFEARNAALRGFAALPTETELDT
ncbi:MAG: hypothetical protein K0Q91_1377 [Fibrobacteria bacterium]|nr:hypothetical protein [Fibrobacteria bacterium]